MIAIKVLNLYVGWFEKRKKCFYSKQLEEELSGLYPGQNVNKRIMEYYQKKTENAIKLGVVGIIIVLLCMCKNMMSGDLVKDKFLEREPVGGSDKEIVLDAEIGDENIEDVAIVVGEQEITEVAKKKLLADIEKHLEVRIRGENSSLEYVNQPLNLITEWEDTDVSIEWTSSDYGILKEDGTFGKNEISEEGIVVELVANIFLDEMQDEKKISVTVFPQEKTEEELKKDELIQLIDQREKKTRTNEFLELPSVFQGKSIQWIEQKEKYPLLIALFPFVAVFAVIWGMDKDVHKQYKERNKQLLLEYSEFVSKLQLLIGAGMSLRNAFIRLGIDYQKRRATGGKKRFVYEEVMMTVRKLENGASEEEAYDYFAKRCNLSCYRKLVSIIIQNQKKGMEGLKESLSTERRNAFDERKQEAARLGEEAGTKLLLPMMMMMGVVLMIIVIPAYFSFGGI